MAGSPTSIVCPSCGKSYANKPALAGKRVKCKCGGVISVPAAPAVEEAAPEGFDDMDFGAASHDAPPATPAPVARPRGAAATVGAAAGPVATPPTAATKDDWGWWKYLGMSAVIAGLSAYEFYRLGQLESGEVESVRLRRWEAFLYNLIGRYGLLILGLALAAALLGMGVHQLMQKRKARA